MPSGVHPQALQQWHHGNSFAQVAPSKSWVYCDWHIPKTKLFLLLDQYVKTTAY